jgi:dienelactone hydrolase
VHGDRRADRGVDPTLTFVEFGQAWSSDPGLTDAMVDDWRATLDAVQKLEEVGEGPVGWWGLSMGTILGLPFVATEPRVRVAVLGLMGLTGPTVARIAADAPKIACPTMFLVQADDELFPRDRAYELFDLIGSREKTMHVNPGRHSQVPRHEFDATERFLALHLGSVRTQADQ